MRRVIAAIATAAVVGALAIDVGARTRANDEPDTRTRPAIGVGDPQRPDPRVCDELGELRQQLARLQQELRHLHAALATARRAGNRERAEAILQQIRRVQAPIEDVQQKIRRLQRICR
jgi:hypothetical protein